MTYTPIDDNFNDPLGRFLLWDTTAQHEADKGFLATNSHVDLRIFDSTLARPRRQSDLDLLTQTQLDLLTNDDLENVAANSENWAKTGNGFSGLTVGKIVTYKNWSGLQATTTGVALTTTLTSSMATTIDISSMDSLSVIFPNYNIFDSTSYIQLSSATGGVFTSNTSIQIPFSANTAGMPELRVPVSAFTNTGFSLSAVTGVRIVLNRTVAPAADLTLTIMAIRAVKTAWAYHQLDYNTRYGVIGVPVTLNGGDPSGGSAPIPLIRGDDTKNDPIPADGTFNVYFYPGGQATHVASGSNYNIIEIIFREQKDVPDDEGDWMTARLKWHGTATIFETQQYHYASGVVTPATLHSTTTGVTLSTSSLYQLSVSVTGTKINASINSVDNNLTVTSNDWTFVGITNADYQYRNGRVGLYGSFLDRDAYVTSFNSTATAYATLTTRPYYSYTPVDGCQLSAVYSTDQNLFADFSAADLFLDLTKTSSNRFSYRTTSGLTTNQFIIEDWTHSYIDLDIWVPGTITLANQPIIELITPSGTLDLGMPTLQPSQWNRLHFDLGGQRDQLTGIPYAITIRPGDNPDKLLGSFWIDANIIIGRRKVSWQVRAAEFAHFRDFYHLVNRGYGAVHLAHNERGTQLQLRAIALTPDAWISSFTLHPRYAQLGLPVYDQAYDT